jgi:hypothetical protein
MLGRVDWWLGTDDSEEPVGPIFKDCGTSKTWVTNHQPRRVKTSMPGVLSLEVKFQDWDAEHSSPSTVAIKNVGSYTSTPYVLTWRGA